MSELLTFPDGLEVTAVRKYAGRMRDIAKRIKIPVDDAALQDAARYMSPLVPSGAVLVPAPSSHGLNPAMLVLASYIATLGEGATVVEAVVRRQAVQSSMLRRQAGKRGTLVAEHVASMGAREPLPPEVYDGRRPIVVIDNVVTEGNTIRAMEAVLGLPLQAVVLADASRFRPSRKNPKGPFVVCVSGSRDYHNLQHVHEVLCLLPHGTVVLHGGARGVDAEADRVARLLGLCVEVQPADSSSYGRAAGPHRTREMVERADFLYAFWDGTSRGTASAIQAAVELGKEFDVILDQ
ncbi:MAG: hypothetical protein ACOYOB_15705 [Myxococcota bacterium]